MADTQDSKSCARKGVGVQVPPSAQIITKKSSIDFFVIMLYN